MNHFKMFFSMEGDVCQNSAFDSVLALESAFDLEIDSKIEMSQKFQIWHWSKMGK
jgi:hypothetical protein